MNVNDNDSHLDLQVEMQKTFIDLKRKSSF